MARSTALLSLLIAAPFAYAQAVVSVVATDATASESPADNGQFTIRRDDGSDARPLTVAYSLEGSATPGDDYSPLAGSVTLGAGQREANLSIEVPGDDGVIEGSETVTIRLMEDESGGDDDDDDGDDDDDDGNGDDGDDDGNGNDDDGYVLGTATASVTILDSSSSATVSNQANASENSTSPGQAVVALGSRNGTGNAITVQYSVAGSATPAVDYVALSGVASIPPGSETATINVTPLDDAIAEGEETVEITLTSTSSESVTIGSPASVTLSINDDDPAGGGDDDDGDGDDGDGDGDDGSDDDGDDDGDNSGNSDNEVHVSVLASESTASETPAGNGAFVVRRVGGNMSRPVTVNYFVGGSATSGSDYAPLTGTVNLDSQAEEVSIPVNVAGNDDVFEGDETVTVTLREADDVVLVAASATVTITDSPHTVTVRRSSNATENPVATGEFTAALGARNESGSALVVEYSVGGSATAGSDYQPLSGTASIAAGSSSAAIVVTPQDDDLIESDETVEIALTGTSNPEAPVGSPATAVLTIVDNDTGGDDGGDDGGDGGSGDDGGSATDLDGDGLSNDREQEIGTDPEVADTDGDGVNDGSEDTAGTDPLDERSFADADGDLVPDVVELADGTDPGNPQSFADGDSGGTADHIETTSYLSYNISATNPGDAGDDQRDLDGDGLPDLLEIRSGWEPGSPESPTAGGADDDDGNGITNAVEAHLAALRIDAVDAVSDHDRDGYPDVAEVTLGLDPLRASERDTDGDGVPDVVEVRAGVDIDATSDTDGDGIPDAREIALGADALDANSPVANGALDDDGNGASNAIDHVLQLLDPSGETDAGGDNDGDGIVNADEIRFGTDPFRDEQPAIWIELVQAEVGPANGLLTDGGTATATAMIGGHQTGTLVYDWSESDNAILAVSSGGLSGKALSLAPLTLPTGPYELVLNVHRTVGNYTSPVSILRVPINVLAGADAAQVADADHDGVPDASDDADAREGFANELQVQSGARMQVANGMRLQLGSTARIARTGSSRVTASDIASAGDGSGGSVGNSEDNFDYLSGIFDFEVANLPEVGSIVQIVIPQGTAIGEFPEYRKFDAGTGWVDFVEDANNSIESAAGSSGDCPPPGDDSYQPGLAAGHFCIQLTIEDGGPNDGDADLGPNGVIKDPGGVATPKGQVSAGQGGGSTAPLTLIVLALVAILARRRGSARYPWHAVALIEAGEHRSSPPCGRVR